MEKLVLNYVGRDNWDRPVYKNNGNLYVDVDPRQNKKADICTKQGNEFYGEPCTSIAKDIEIEFIPKRDVW